MTEEPRRDAARLAIECVMMWLEPDRQRAAEHITENVLGGETIDQLMANRNQLITGLLNLSMFLVRDVARLLDPDADQIEKAREILRHRALNLPEG
jgi:hypothetical protein